MTFQLSTPNVPSTVSRENQLNLMQINTIVTKQGPENEYEWFLESRFLSFDENVMAPTRSLLRSRL